MDETGNELEQNPHPESLTEARLTELEDLASKASKGPWIANSIGSEGYHVMSTAGAREVRGGRIGRFTYQPEDGANANLSAASRTAIPALVAEVRRLRSLLPQDKIERE